MNQGGEKTVLILGGGFAGIACALRLAKKNKQNLKIKLVSDKPHFEYHGALYRMTCGFSPLEVCVQIKDIIGARNIQFDVDRIMDIDTASKLVVGSSGTKYRYDYLVVALGAQTDYFAIPGLEQNSFGMRTITHALALKEHIHKQFELFKKQNDQDNLQPSALNFAIVGAGATGVELAGQLAQYLDILAQNHNIDRKLIKIELIEGAENILPLMPKDFSDRFEKRLQSLGVVVMKGKKITAQEIGGIKMQDGQLSSQTVVWTAGVKANNLYAKIPVLKKDRAGRIGTDEYLQMSGLENVFVAGDGASTLKTGYAQTALYDGKFIAETIFAKEMNYRPYKYRPPLIMSCIPVGLGWAGFYGFGIKLYGSTGWFFRRLLDLVVFMNVLPLKKAMDVFGEGKLASESCDICSRGEKG